MKVRLVRTFAAALVVLGGAASAQSLHAGVRLGAAVGFPSVTGLVVGAQVESRGLGADWLSARLSGALASGIALDAIVRLNGGDPGPAYFGAGVGLSFSGDLEGRLLVGYQWALTGSLGAFLEAVPRFALGGGGPHLDLLVGLDLRVLGPAGP